MNVFTTGLLIRALIVLGMICLLVLAGALHARREKHRVSNADGDVRTNPGQRPAVAHRSFRYPAIREWRGANDFDATARTVQRRAA
jgi:hypothetical protein